MISKKSAFLNDSLNQSTKSNKIKAQLMENDLVFVNTLGRGSVLSPFSR